MHHEIQQLSRGRTEPMSEDGGSSDRIRLCIDRLAQGDEQACTELINTTMARLSALTRRMFRDFRRLGRWEQSDDICQNATLRLWKALKATRPTSLAEFHRLAALQVRRELLDQVRRYFGAEGLGANHASNADANDSGSTPPDAFDSPQSTLDPASLARWAEFHERAADLPEDERAVFDLIWYQGLPQLEAAEILGLSERTLKRRWLAARLSLARVFDKASPW
jgi:RNA polymerase sigma-70 factor (ECF subfamily)